MRFFPGRSGRIDLMWATLFTLGLLAFFLQTELRWTQGELGTPLDDAWIHFQFARNISQGAGFSYNPGEPTPGSTAPLWTLLLAPVGLVSTGPTAFLIASISLSALFLLATVWLSYGLTAELTGRRDVALLAALGVACSGRFLWAGLAGMETTAFAALSLAAVWAYGRWGMRLLPALLFGLASQFRPEGHALFLLALADAAWTIGWAGRTEARPEPLATALLRSLAPALLLYGVIAAPYTLFALATTGHPLPNTFYAKSGTQHLFSIRAFRETLWLHWRDNPVALLLIPFGLMPVWRRNRLLVVWLLLLPVLVAFTVDQVAHHGRYSLPLIPFQLIVAVIGGWWLLRRLAPANRPLAGLLLALMILVGGTWSLPHWAGQLGQNTREIIEIDIRMARWLAANTAEDALIGVDDIGAIGFLSGRRLFDLNGLISPEVWPAMRNEPPGRARNAAMTRILSTAGPDYLAIFPVWHWEIATNPYLAQPVERFWVDTHTIIGEQEAMIYRATWPYLPEATAEPVPPIVLDGAIGLLQHELSPPTTNTPTLKLHLYWTSLAAVDQNYDVFVHVLDADGQIVAQADQQPVFFMAPTGRWQPGDRIRDVYEIAWPVGLPPGEYTVTTGMYLRETGVRLPAAGEQVRDNAAVLGTITWPAEP